MIRNILRGIAAPAVIALALLAALSAPAEAASCKGESCYNKNPATYCPSGAVTRSYWTENNNAAGTNGWWQLRHHKKCQAAWVRVGLTTGDVFYSGLSYQGRIQSKRKPRNEGDWIVSTRTSKVLKATGFSQDKSLNSLMVPMTAGWSPKVRFCWRLTYFHQAKKKYVWRAWKCSSWK